MNNIAIDLGGTNLRIAKIDDDMNIIEVIKIPTEADKGVDQIVEKIITGINDLKDDSTKAVGIGIPGQINYEKRIIIDTNNLPFKDYPLGDKVKEATGLEVVLQNDANVAGLGEAIIGSGKDYDNIYYVTWSTGVGGALVIDNKLINGKNMCTGEIGNVIIWPDHPTAQGFFNNGSLEGVSSGTHLKNEANNLGFDNAGELIEAYKDGNSEAIDIIETVTDNMARGLANILHIVEVDAFVFGGGVTLKSGDVLIPKVLEKVNNYLLPAMQDSVIIEIAKLEDDAGLYGAAYIAKNI